MQHFDIWKIDLKLTFKMTTLLRFSKKTKFYE
jgi:hypothetical protein